MKGYKVFNPDWTCMGFRYEVGKTYEIKDEPVLCKRGFHFCEELTDCFKFYEFTPENKVAEVEATGQVVFNEGKSCTNRITVVRELSWDEVLRAVNTGRGCTGFRNSGNYCSGKFNSGWNCSGNHNSGWNCSGNHNSGWNCSGSNNSGNFNSGNFNSGWNCSGNFNSGWNCSGNFNSGDFNATDYSSGCFNTTLGTIRIFNRPTSWTLEDWIMSEACAILRKMPNGTKWGVADDMTDEEKAEHPEAETTSGYLIETDDAMRQEWWDGLIDSAKATVKSLPNFDAEIFEQITGIKV